MRCPYCSVLENRVMDSRLSQGGEVTRRRRECEGCRRRYTTYERVEYSLPLVVKKDGTRQPYNREKLIAGLRRACVKRPVAAETLERLLDRLERQLVASGDSEVNSALLGNKVLSALRDTDPVAYVRFASVYRDFKNVREFMSELDQLVEEDRS